MSEKCTEIEERVRKEEEEGYEEGYVMARTFFLVTVTVFQYE
jgi:hypothetical protein